MSITHKTITAGHIPPCSSEKLSDSELLEMSGRLHPSQIWDKAFKAYNSDKNNRMLSMGCRSCFNKVLVYFLAKRFNTSAR